MGNRNFVGAMKLGDAISEGASHTKFAEGDLVVFDGYAPGAACALGAAALAVGVEELHKPSEYDSERVCDDNATYTALRKAFPVLKKNLSVVERDSWDGTEHRSSKNVEDVVIEINDSVSSASKAARTIRQSIAGALVELEYGSVAELSALWTKHVNPDERLEFPKGGRAK